MCWLYVVFAKIYLFGLYMTFKYFDVVVLIKLAVKIKQIVRNGFTNPISLFFIIFFDY